MVSRVCVVGVFGQQTCSPGYMEAFDYTCWVTHIAKRKRERKTHLIPQNNTARNATDGGEKEAKGVDDT